MDETERAYLAGFIDGEGCFSSGLKHGSYCRPKIGITQLDPTYLLWLRDELGFGNINYVRGSAGPNIHTRFIVNRPGHIKIIIRLVYPYLRQKKPQARIVWDMLKLPPRER